MTQDSGPTSHLSLGCPARPSSLEDDTSKRRTRSLHLTSSFLPFCLFVFHCVQKSWGNQRGCIPALTETHSLRSSMSGVASCMLVPSFVVCRAVSPFLCDRFLQRNRFVMKRSPWCHFRVRFCRETKATIKLERHLLEQLPPPSHLSSLQLASAEHEATHFAKQSPPSSSMVSMKSDDPQLNILFECWLNFSICWEAWSTSFSSASPGSL